MRWSALLLPAAWLLEPALGVFADDAFQIDYHIPLLGLPQPHTTFFHQPYANSKASLLYTLSEKSVLGAINPKDGAIVWRQALAAPANATNMFLRAGDAQDMVVSAVNNEVAAWAAADGRLIWSKSLGDGLVEDLAILEMPGVGGDSKAKDVLLLYSNGNPVVQRLDGSNGNVKWEYVDKRGDTAFQVATSSTGVHLITLHKAMMGGLKINVVSLDPLTGRTVDVQSLALESDVTDPNQIIFVGANSASPLVAWTNKAQNYVKVHILGTKVTSTLSIYNIHGDPIKSISIHVPIRPNTLTHFLVHVQATEGHWADVYHINLETSSIQLAYSLQKLAGQGAFSCSTVDANVFFTRVTESEMTLTSSASNGILGRWPLPVLPGALVPLQVTAEVSTQSSTYPTRAAVLAANGLLVLIKNDEISWARPEFLSQVTTAIFADLAEEQSLVRELEIEGHQNVLAAFVHRLKRHLNDLETLRAWLPKSVSSMIPTGDSSDHIQKDKFGFRKYVVMALEDGRVTALDTSHVNDTAWVTTVEKLSPGQIWDAPELRISSQGAIEVWEAKAARPFVIDVETGEITATPDTDLSSTEENPSSPQSAATFSFELIGNSVRAFSLAQPQSPVWQLALPPTDRVAGLSVRPTVDPVASIGKVLGDRRVLYKYLNPNLALVSSVNDAAGNLTVHLLDTVSGASLYSASHSDVDTSKTIASTVAENWFSYSFTLDSSASASSRGHQIVIAEMYESPVPNDRGALGSASNYSSLTSSSQGPAIPHVISQVYLVPEEIKHMSVTRTRQGITSRDLLVTLADSKGIVAIPRQVLDARRPVGRDPTADEAAEGLMRYAPNLEFDPKWYLNHQRELIGIKSVVTGPSLLESTSLVFAYGVDIFGTRVAPSFSFDVLGKGFNKFQMLVTVAALGLAVVFVAPFVRRKQINQRWQVSS